ncbi:Dynamin superfamily [Carpediemonas membranifera]|uniref:Dynamin superfamily n=1 Tax=Carpediemonas membranifera TaxID=201153 RepID=A0A8J6DXN7_9EUKA|nr:Dynamin superfamily [Carpediemonas membranifera]|eukprot:KAG9390654.1 Dynamin superfamily [Carpediemonas membranifera]
MIKRYISKEETIILAVCPATSDLPTAESIKMAREVDRSGCRTIGVLTKVDQVNAADREKMIVEPCTGEALVNLSLGYIAVRNRSSQDLKNNMSYEKAFEVENAFFTKPEFSRLKPTMFGRDALAMKLTEILSDRVSEKLPDLKKEIANQLEQVASELQDPRFSNVPPEDAQGRRFVLMKILNDSVAEIRAVLQQQNAVKLDGNYRCRDFFNAMADLSKIIHANSVDFTMDLEDEEFKEKIQEARLATAGMGAGVGNYLSHQAAMPFVRYYLDSIRDAIDTAIETASKVVLDTTIDAIKSKCNAYPHARQVVEEMLSSFIEETADSVRTSVSNLIRMEQSVIYACNENYDKALAQRMADRLPEADIFSENFQTGERYFDKAKMAAFMEGLKNTNANLELNDDERLYDNVQVYISHCGDRLMDAIPMKIAYHFILHCWQTFTDDLGQINSEGADKFIADKKIMTIIKEDRELRGKRVELENTRKILMESKRVIREEFF